MTESLMERFSGFVAVAKTELHHSTDSVKLGGRVDELEKQNSFGQLVAETRSTFSGDYHEDSSEHNWRRAVHNYFCQSGLYTRLANREQVETEKAFSAHCSAFESRETATTYLVPIELASFGDSDMDFGDFRIRRYPTKELESILRNKLNADFFPWAEIGQDDLRLLSEYWCIQAASLSAVERIGPFYLHWRVSVSDTILFGDDDELETQRRVWYSEHRDPVRSILLKLSLFDWSTSQDKRNLQIDLSQHEDWPSARHINIPFVLQVSADPLSAPRTKPNFSELLTEEMFLEERGESVTTRETWGDLSLTSERTEEFKVFVKEIGHTLDTMELYDYRWSFMSIALGYFSKAYFMTPGFEQMLWHITSLEALLGEKGGGVSRRLSERIRSICGDQGGDRYAARFAQIYNLRNSIVHGGVGKGAVNATHLLDAYLINRRIILWFLRVLRAMHVEVVKTGNHRDVPGREEILAFIDLDRTSREDRRLQWLLNTFPDGFSDDGSQAF